MDNFLNKHLLLTTSHTPKEILKRKYSVNYKTSVLLLLIIVAKKKPTALLENDVHALFHGITLILSISLQEAVLRIFANVAVSSKNRRCRIFT